MPAAPCAYGESQSINRPFGLGSFMSHVFTTKRESTKAYEYEKSTKFPGSRAHDMDAPQCSTCQEFNVAGRPVKSSHGGSRCWLRLYAEFSEAGGWQPQWTHGSRTALALGGFDIQLMDDLD